MTNFELQLREAAIKFFSYFWSRLVRMKSSKKVFTFWDIGLYYIFVMPLRSFEIGTKDNPS